MNVTVGLVAADGGDVIEGVVTRRLGVSYEELWPDYKRNTYIVMSLLMTVVGIIGNTLVILAPFFHKVLLTPRNVFIINLAIADMIISVISNPFTLVALFDGPGLFYSHPVLCDILGDMCVLSCGASLLNIFFIAINRYVAVCYHQHYSTIYQFRTTIPAAVAIWFLSALITFPSSKLGLAPNIFDELLLICTADLHSDPPIFNFVFVFLFLLTPILATAVLYIKLFMFVRRSKKNAAGGKAASGIQPADIKLAKTLLISFFAFVLMWMCYMLGAVFDSNGKWGGWFWMLGAISAHGSSSGANAIIYGITNTNFKRGYIKVLRKVSGGMCSASATVDASSSSTQTKTTSAGPLRASSSRHG